MGEHTEYVIILCPGQGAQQVGMGKCWAEESAAARAVLDEADRILAGAFPESLSSICFEGPADLLNRTDVSQPAIFACSVASYHGLLEAGASWDITAAAGLSLGEYTALHLAGVFSFEDGLTLVAERGRLMQDAAEQSDGGMVALIGADEQQAREICDSAEADGKILVCANFNAPGQIVLSGDQNACSEAVERAEEQGLRAKLLTVAGAFHSPHMQPAADGLGQALAGVDFKPLSAEVWSNVTAQPHEPDNGELLRRRLVEQLVSPVRWAQGCSELGKQTKIGYSSTPSEQIAYHELAPGRVLAGLMRRIDRKKKVQSHDEPKK